jgi:hypothetical protein
MTPRHNFTPVLLRFTPALLSITEPFVWWVPNVRPMFFHVTHVTSSAGGLPEVRAWRPVQNVRLLRAAKYSKIL